MDNSNLHIESDLFRRIAKGDEAAFTAIYQKYTSTLYFFAIKILKSELWAEEIVQEIFLNLWVNRESLDKVANPGGYLNRMIVHKCIDWIRRHELELKVQYFISNQTGITESVTEVQHSLKESETVYRAAIDLLPPQGKLVFKLKYDESLSYDQISEKLNISPHTVRNHLAKSLEFIRTYLLQNGISPLVFLYLWCS